MKRLESFDSFGMNAAYRHWDEIGWYPQYYSCLDTVVGLSHAEEIARLLVRSEEYGIRLFFLRQNLIEQLAELPNHWKLVNFDKLRAGDDLLQSKSITTGSHTLAWAASLGYRSIALLGMDCNYQEIVPGASPVEGKVLEITEEKENPNYFFDGYQRKGDRFHIPNPGREVHLESWREVAALLDGRGVRVLNANPVSKIDAFDVCERESLFAPGAATDAGFREIPVTRPGHARPYQANRPVEIGTREYAREDKARLSETDVIARLACRGGRTGVMLDVGAHYGTSAIPFARAGWKVVCFEPDAKNRVTLQERLGKHGNVVIDPRGIDETPSDKKAFYRSDVSTGISSLLPFHESHASADAIETTTVALAMEQYKVAKVDFLKIDVEGLEMAVLKGVPWDRVKPRMIEAEFEDAKTASLGYTWKDLARFLTDRGYTVYVSEWHPIERYGVAHDWRALKRFPCELSDPAGWGNLLAFLEDPGNDAVASAASEIFRDSLHKELQRAESDLKKYRKSPLWFVKASAWKVRFRRDRLRKKLQGLRGTTAA
jgi:FkbM family methyltransferase